MKKIKLTQDKFALVDDEDFEYLNQWKWKANKGLHTYYASRQQKVGFKKWQTILMHRLILNITNRAILVDHKDGNGLNNRKKNLRPANYIQNARNSPSRTNRPKGIRFINNKYEVRVGQLYIGRFIKLDLAIKAYNNAALSIYGEFAYLNK